MIEREVLEQYSPEEPLNISEEERLERREIKYAFKQALDRHASGAISRDELDIEAKEILLGSIRRNVFSPPHLGQFEFYPWLLIDVFGNIQASPNSDEDRAIIASQNPRFWRRNKQIIIDHVMYYKFNERR